MSNIRHVCALENQINISLVGILKYAFYNDILITTCQLADVVVRYNSAQQVVLDGRPFCQSKSVRPGEGAPRPLPLLTIREAIDNPAETCEVFCTISELNPENLNETCTQPVESNSKHFWGIYFKPRNASESRYSAKIEYSTGNKIWATNSKTALAEIRTRKLKMRL